MVEARKEPTQEWIVEHKKKYGRIFTTVIAGEVYVYRYLKRSEFRELNKGLTPEMTQQGPVVNSEQAMEVEDNITEMCTLWPEDYSKDNVPAAVPAILSAYISDSSGTQPPELPKEL